MKAGIGFCRRPLWGALTVGIFVIGTSAFGQEIGFVPDRVADINSPAGEWGTAVSVTDVGGCATYAADAGGFELTLDLQAQGWGNAAGSPTLGAIQATVDPAGYSNGVGSTLSPKGWPATPSDGAWQAHSTCQAGGDGRPCTGPFDSGCTGNGFCIANPAWVMPPCASDLPAIATPTLDYAWATAAQNDCNTDLGGVMTMGSLLLNVDAAAAGTYVISLDPDANNSFMTAGDGQPIQGVVFGDACITITTGSCCFDIGPGSTECEEDHTAATCNDQDGPRVFRANEACPPAGSDCPACQSDADCDDGSACTNDSCDTATLICSNTLNHDPALTCCNPNAGRSNHLTVIDDGDVCTDDICNADGSVSHPQNTASCDDDNDCTVEDTCDQGACTGEDVNGDDCNDDGDCRVGLCEADEDVDGDGDTGDCKCLLCTPVLIKIDTGDEDALCFGQEEVFDAQIALGPGGSEDIFGGQFLLHYDDSCVELLSVESCPDSPFPAIIEWEAGGGTVWWAATTQPGNPVPTKGPNDIVCMVFKALPGCETCEMCFDSVNPRNTLLSNATGNPVPICEGDECSKTIPGRGIVDLNTPEDAGVNADCGVPTAVVTWDTPFATDTCDVDDLVITCIGAHDGGLSVGHLIVNPDGSMANGGEHPQGTTFYRCEATNSCGDTSVAVWTVDVSDQHGLHVEVELAGGMNPGMFWRAIDFQLFDNLCSDPTEFCEVLQFGAGAFNKHANAWLKVDKSNYSCISARDNLHTLRGCSVIECVDNAWSATFKGDAVLGGNGLVGGNLDAWKALGHGNTIDVLDAGVYLGIIARNDTDELWHDPHTSCGQAGPDGDINADGHTDSADYSFILENFLKASKICCCDSEADADTAVTSISVKWLRANDWSSMIPADIDRNGFVDLADMTLYMEGHLPVMQQEKSQKRAASTR